jgi:transposase InsO family protein
MIRFINEYRDRFGVELICRVLRPAVQGFLTARGYRAAIGRAPSARQLKDELLVPEVARLHAENYGVYGRRKMHALMRRQGWDIGRDQTERLMRLAGVRGVRKSKRVFTTRSDKTTVLPSDLVNRRFTAPAPRRLWVCDVTYVATWSGFAYVAFVTDVYSRRIVGWNVASTLRSRSFLAGARHGRLERRRPPQRTHPPRGPRVELHRDGLHRPDRRTRRRPLDRDRWRFVR